MAADLVTRGTTTRSATEIARQIESLGASLGAGAGVDSSAVSLQTRCDRANEAFTIFADVVRNPAFADEELDRATSQALDGFKWRCASPARSRSFAMTRAIYGDAPYGASPRQPASPPSHAKISPASTPRTGVPTTRCSSSPATCRLRRALRSPSDISAIGRSPATPLPARPDASACAAAPRTIVVDLPRNRPGGGRFGLRGVARTDADYFPTLVANNVLGGGYSARLNQEIRIKRGLSYGAGSSLAARMAPGPIIAAAQTRNDAAVQVSS